MRPGSVLLRVLAIAVLGGCTLPITIVVVDEETATLFIEATEDLPNAADPLGWTSLDYDTSQDEGKGDPDNGAPGWQGGVFGVGFGDDDDNTLLASDGQTYSVYTRTPFTLGDPGDFVSMVLEVDYDDAVGVWLNATEVYRSANLEGQSLVWNSTPSELHEASGTRSPGPAIDLGLFLPLLREGGNILAAAVWNITPADDDLTLIPRLTLSEKPLGDRPDLFHCYLTWQGDTGTTMTVNYHTRDDTPESLVYYDTVSHSGDVESYAFVADGTSHRIPGLGNVVSRIDRAIHVVELTGLAPGGLYYFIAGDPVAGFTEEKRFRTIPNDTAKIRFIVGGDMGTAGVVRDLLTHAASTDPMFGLIGGDVAYANGSFDEWYDWEAWLNNWESIMVTSEGCTVPIVMAIGNHETQNGVGHFTDPLGGAPFYFGYFAQEGRGFESGRRSYFSRTFGPRLTMLVLDTGHVAPLDGAQSAWLEQELASLPEGQISFASYHFPLYPSHRSFAGAPSGLVRPVWLPIFDAYGLTAGFEHHDHMFKRTKRLRNNQPHPEGTVYLGDGCFGRSPRSGDQARALDNPLVLFLLGLDESYLAAWEPRRHFWAVETPNGPDGGDLLRFTAIDENGVPFHEYEQSLNVP